MSNYSLIPESEIEFIPIRAQGSGGQNVNKVSSAIHLRFDVLASSLSERVKRRLMISKDHRINKDGVIVIKAQIHRTQEKNRQDAIRRLNDLIKQASVIPKKRVPTKPSKGAKKRRLEDKTKRGKTKRLRGRVSDE